MAARWKGEAVMAELEGGCGCGAVRYRLTTPPMFVNCCHCTECQRQNGSAFAVNALIEADRVLVMSGAPEPAPVPTPSGRPHPIYRCPACRTPVWSEYGGRPQIRFVCVGSLDDPAALPPDAHIFTRSRQPWVVLPEATPSFEIYYDMGSLWPADSQQRRRAALG
jgi:hypothetical protein